MKNVIDLKMEKWVVIVLPYPIDWGWDLSVPLFPESMRYGNYESELCHLHEQSRQKLRSLIKGIGLKESDLRHQPHIIPFPFGNCSWEILGFCFKQEDNGDTYIAIPEKFYVPIKSILLESFGTEWNTYRETEKEVWIKSI